jgi:hypothetical protein
MNNETKNNWVGRFVTSNIKNFKNSLLRRLLAKTFMYLELDLE